MREKTAGNRRSFVEANRGKDLAEQGLVAINIGGAGEGKMKETGTEGSGGREGEQGGPTGSEGSNGCRPQRSRHSTGTAPSEEANELGGLGIPAATNLNCKDNKPAREEWRRAAPWYWRWCRRAAPLASRGETRVESICDDLDAAIIEVLGVDVEVEHCSNCSPSLAANTGSSTLEREATGAQEHGGKHRGGHREGRQDGGSDKLQRREARASEAGRATKRGKRASPRRRRQEVAEKVDSTGEGAQEAKAAGACSAALRRPSPPWRKHELARGCGLGQE
ncbi:unnamed protein product, partial [Symbiodinium sp. KB8]